MVWYGSMKGKVMQDFSITGYSCFVGNGGMGYRKDQRKYLPGFTWTKQGSVPPLPKQA